MAISCMIALMAKAQRCLMCGDVMYHLTSLGEAVDDQWPERRADARFGTILVCPHCEAEHITTIDNTPGAAGVLRVRALKPRD